MDHANQTIAGLSSRWHCQEHQRERRKKGDESPQHTHTPCVNRDNLVVMLTIALFTNTGANWPGSHPYLLSIHEFLLNNRTTIAIR
jgi:hypothetical protein